ncbi:post-GPI attachment to proteins factor 4-like [Antedon mediterranea]|uniref:post-GPI attachment to proteins factor 4-like n=1 Tax=Antedon mediterranea TaxID=105859 RepID=UPI003AF4F91E
MVGCHGRLTWKWKMRFKKFSYIIQIIVVLYILTFGLILPITCWNLPFSRYYIRGKSTHTLDVAIKKDRLEGEAAYKYFSEMEDLKERNFYEEAFTKKKPKYAIGVITVSRHTVDKNSEAYSPQYLPRVVAKFDQLLVEHNRKDILFFICNAQTEPEEHEAAIKLSRYVPSVQKQPIESTNRRTVHAREQEKQDYVFCINQMRKFNATYSILVQDDALPYPQFIKHLDRIVNTRIENKFIHDRLEKNLDNLASLKFYFPEKWEGYGTDNNLILELIATGLLGGGVLYAIFNIFVKFMTTPQRILLYSLCSFYFGLLMFVIGRPYLLWLRLVFPDFYTVTGAPECCIPAVLYKTEFLQNLEYHLNGIQCYTTFPLDVAISRFFKTVSLKQYLVVPNLFDHIGVFSSLHKTPKDPHSFMT